MVLIESAQVAQLVDLDSWHRVEGLGCPRGRFLAG